ncbi:hypothetical protein RIVM261_070720 [Rivularia sp. IAM M-261]|nr:hypothetical protein RIVM261_070720 [Rivularia sp. IAM M-261]
MSQSLEEALNETTPSERLRELAVDFRAKIRFAVAQNANTPPDTLIKLFSEAPNFVLNNPALSLLLLEKPCFFKDLYKSNRRVFQQFELPKFYLNWALDNSESEIRASLAISPKIPVSFLIKLAEDKEPGVRVAVARNPCTPVQILDKLSQDDIYNVRRRVVENSNTSSDIIRILATNCNQTFQRIIAKHLNTPKDILEILALKSDRETSCLALRNPNIPTKVGLILSG